MLPGRKILYWKKSNEMKFKQNNQVDSNFGILLLQYTNDKISLVYNQNTCEASFLKDHVNSLVHNYSRLKNKEKNRYQLCHTKKRL